MTHPNAEVVRALFEAHGRGDEARIRELVTEDVVWHLPGRSAVAGAHHGPDALLALWRREAALLGGRVVPTVHDVVAGDEHVVVLARGDLRRGDRPLSFQLISVCHVRDGRVSAAWLHVVSGEDAFDDLWS